MAEKVIQHMKRGAVTCTPETSIREVSQIMGWNRIHYCVVVNDQHEVDGIISARSILKAYGKDLDKTKAKDILLPYTITITPNSPIDEAIELMCKKKIEHIVIVSEHPASKAILGILHASDIISKIAKTKEKEENG